MGWKQVYDTRSPACHLNNLISFNLHIKGDFNLQFLISLEFIQILYNPFFKNDT